MNINSITYRKSTKEDKECIKELIKLRFGPGYITAATYQVHNRYLLAFDEGRLIAMTGLWDSNTFNSYEIDWTCIRKEYEGNGIITSMISELIKDINRDIYCSCWRLGTSDRVNLYSAMNKLGFVLVNKEHKKYNSKYNKCKGFCNLYNENCICYEDLYLRKYKP